MSIGGFVRVVCAVATVAFAQAVAAQDYPSKPINLIVPLAAGGNADASARNLAGVAHRYLGQPVVVQNLPGASGIVGSQKARSSAADGYTLLVARGASHAINPAINPAVPYKWNDWTFISLLELNPVVCAVKGDSPWKTSKDLFEYLKNNKGKLNYATAGPGTTEHIGVLVMLMAAGLDPDAAVMVGYKSGGEATQALLAGSVQFLCNPLPTMIGHLKGGLMRGLLVSTKDRLHDHPEIPTARELNLLPVEDVMGWSALYGPPGLPADVVSRWSDALKKIAHDPDWQRGNAVIGAIPAIRSPQETEKFAREQYELFSRLGAQLGLTR